MAMPSEELKVKVSLDTRGVDEGADRVKSKLKGIGDVAGNMSDATIEATGSVEALSTALTTLTGIRVAEVIGLDAEAIKQFTDNIRLSFKSAYYSVKEFNENAKNSFSKSFYNENIGDDFTLSGAFKDLSINIKSLGRDVKKLGSNLKTSFVEGHKAAEGLRKKIVALGVVMVPVAGIWSSLNASRLGSEITNTANRVGMSTAKYQEWMYILEQTGADITDLTGA
jgi:phage-related minor tail protein